MSSSPYNFPYQVARRTLDLLVNHKVMRNPTGVVFYVWPRRDRVILAFNPTEVVLEKLNDKFAHELSTILKGRKVVRTNSRGIFLQVGYEVPPAPVLLSGPVALDMSQQPSPWHIPIGLTRKGEMWISLTDEADSVLVGGTRRMGKSGFTHGIIQALLHGNRTEVYAWDGKQGSEYARYIGHARFHYIGSIERGLLDIQRLLDDRQRQIQATGHNSVAQHNAAGHPFIEPIALVIDEVAALSPDSRLQQQYMKQLQYMVELYGYLGLYPILATNNPVKASVVVKSNLATRICFGVPSFQESLIVLSKKGAETLPKRRGMILWENELVEFQSFDVPYVEATEEQKRMAMELSDVPAAVSTETPDPIAQLAEQIRDQWQPGMSKRAVGRLLGMEYAGSNTRKIDAVIEFLSATTTTTDEPLSDENEPENGE